MYELTADDRTLEGRLRPCTALGALAKFMRDPDDIAQVFRVVRALDGSTAEQGFRRFCATATGRALLARTVPLAEVLADRVALRELPEGSLGRAYLAFVQCERISVQVLLDAAARGGIHSNTLDQARLRYRGRLHAMHDLLHVVTGYGTDELGEACLLAFTYAQNRTRGILPIVYVLGGRVLLNFPGVKALPAIREGFEFGRSSAWLAAQDWEALLARPLSEVRDRLGICPPRHYLSQAARAELYDLRRRRRLGG